MKNVVEMGKYKNGKNVMMGTYKSMMAVIQIVKFQNLDGELTLATEEDVIKTG
jgi:hypothetical protein